MTQCLNSPSGQHCYCTRMDGRPLSEPYYSVIPPVLKCCWCGLTQQNEHGPFANPPHNPWTGGTGYTAPSIGYVNPGCQCGCTGCSSTDCKPIK